MKTMDQRAKRGAAVLGIGVLLLAGIAGCGTTNSTSPSPNGSGGDGNGSAMTTVRYSEVIRSEFYAPQYVAMAKGFFQQEGINVDMVTSQGSDKGAAALLSGSADIALVGPETSVYIYNQHGDKTVKVFYQLTNTDGSYILSRNKIDNFSWKDLQGKTIISWRPGSAPQMVLMHDLQKNGVQANVVTNIAAQAMVGAFESGKGDFIQVYEPIASQLEQSGAAYYDASVGQEIGNYPETAFEATSSYIQSHPKVIQGWTNAVYKATQWINTHSSTEVAQAIQSYFPGTSVDLIAKSIDQYQKLNAWKTPELSESGLSTLQDVLIASGTEKANERVQYNDVVDASFAQNATK